MATRIGPSTRPSIPNRCTPPRTLMKITRPLNSVRPPSNTGRRRLSAMVEIPAQMARSTIARHQCPVNPSQSEAGTKIRPEPMTGKREKKAIATPQKTGLGFAIVGLPAPGFWGVAVAFFSLLPVIGSGLIFVPASLWLGFTGHWWRAIVLLAICAGISTIADNLLRPVLLGGRTELSGLVIFISVLGGVHLFGMLGLVLGPILVAMAAGVLSVYQESAEGPAITAG